MFWGVCDRSLFSRRKNCPTAASHRSLAAAALSLAAIAHTSSSLADAPRSTGSVVLAHRILEEPDAGLTLAHTFKTSEFYSSALPRKVNFMSLHGIS